MLQKLTDIWTADSWKYFTGEARRPVFGPLRRVAEGEDRTPTTLMLQRMIRECYESEAGSSRDPNDQGNDIKTGLEKWEKEIELPKYTGSAESKIDDDILELANEVLVGDSGVLNTSSRLDCPVTVENFPCKYIPVKTKTVLLEDDSSITVNILGKTCPMFKTTTNTKTPSNTPSLPIHRQNTFCQIPFSTQTLLERSLYKLNFLSSKQRFQPAEPLFKPKFDSDITFSSFSENTNSFFAVHSSLSTKPTHNRKRKLSPHTETQPLPKRTNTEKPKQHKQTVSTFDLFSAPLYIPRKHTSPHPYRQH